MDILVLTKNQMIATRHITLAQNIAKYFCRQGSTTVDPLTALTRADLLAGLDYFSVGGQQGRIRKRKREKGGF